MSNYSDVVAFHRRFNLPSPEQPVSLGDADPELLAMRVAFMHEELYEIKVAADSGNLAEFFDGLIDLVYVAMGTSVMLGLPWEAGWTAVQRANMAKIRAPSAEHSKRGSQYDVVKPLGWTPPDIEEVVQRAMNGTLRCGAKIDGIPDGQGVTCALPFNHDEDEWHTDETHTLKWRNDVSAVKIEKTEEAPATDQLEIA